MLFFIILKGGGGGVLQSPFPQKTSYSTFDFGDERVEQIDLVATKRPSLRLLLAFEELGERQRRRRVHAARRFGHDRNPLVHPLARR